MVLIANIIAEKGLFIALFFNNIWCLANKLAEARGFSPLGIKILINHSSNHHGFALDIAKVFLNSSFSHISKDEFDIVLDQLIPHHSCSVFFFKNSKVMSLANWFDCAL